MGIQYSIVYYKRLIKFRKIIIDLYRLDVTTGLCINDVSIEDLGRWWPIPDSWEEGVGEIHQNCNINNLKIQKTLN